MLHTTKQFVPDKSPVGFYLTDTGKGVTNLYNRSNFVVRQAMTGSKKKHADRQPNEHGVFHLLEQAKPAMDGIRRNTYRKESMKLRDAMNALAPVSKSDAESKEYLKAKEAYEKHREVGPYVFHIPSPEHWYINKNNLKTFMKVTDDPAYRAIQSNLAQRTIQQVGDAWESYFEALNSYKADPDKFTGKPKIPGYRKKGSVSTVVFTKQNCSFHKITDKKTGAVTWELSFPYTTERLDVTGLVETYPAITNMCEIRAVPVMGGFELSITYDDGLKQPEMVSAIPLRIASIDLGVDNIAAIANNVGLTPILIKGSEFKAQNQWYNKILAAYKSMAETQNQVHTSHRIQQIWLKRDRKMDCLCGLVANAIIKYLIANKFDTLVVGKSNGWKQETSFDKTTNQNFMQIPHGKLIRALEFKCVLAGIRFVCREESYTSKASFFDMDDIPVYDPEFAGKHMFSGKRRYRGLYVSADGRKLNADVNGAANTLRKEYADAFQNVEDFRYLMHTETWDVLNRDGKTKVVVRQPKPKKQAQTAAKAA